MHAPADVSVAPELLSELLDAACRTAMSHRDLPHELYALGQLEATANIIYVIAVAQGLESLENNCQRAAQDALARLHSLSRKDEDAALWQARIGGLIGRIA